MVKIEKKAKGGMISDWFDSNEKWNVIVHKLILLYIKEPFSLPPPPAFDFDVDHYLWHSSGSIYINDYLNLLLSTKKAHSTDTRTHWEKKKKKNKQR
jgi:hypothetical protein